MNKANKVNSVKKVKKISYDKGQYSPIEIDTKLVTATKTEDILKILDQYGIAVIKLIVNQDELKEAIKETRFYNTANAMYNKEHQVSEPTEEEIKDPSKWIKRKVGDDAQGMIHQYGTPVHTLIQSNNTLRTTMKTLYGDEFEDTKDSKDTRDSKDIKYLPNRLRKSTKFKNQANTLHIESHKLFEEDKDGNIRLIPGEIACLVGLTGNRRFGFWYMGPDENGIKPDLKPLKELVCGKDSWDNKSEFTNISPEFMHKYYPGRRRMINIDCKEPHLIVWRESNPHEIAGSPSLSLFLSPIGQFNHTKIKRVTSFQPIEYLGLTCHESNLLGLCYNMGGYEWPSGKKLYQFCHQRAYKWFIPKIKDDYKISDKYQQKLVKNGEIDQHTEEYKEKLRELNIELPDIAFHKNTPKFVVDITKLPIMILKDYGFIKT